MAARLRLDAPAPSSLTRVMSHLPVRSVPLLLLGYSATGTVLQLQVQGTLQLQVLSYSGKGPFPYILPSLEECMELTGI